MNRFEELAERLDRRNEYRRSVLVPEGSTYEFADRDCKAAAAAIRELLALVKVLDAAVKPYAEAADRAEYDFPDLKRSGYPLPANSSIHGLRAARAAHQKAQEALGAGE